MTATLPEAPSVPSSAATSPSRFIWHDLMSADRDKALAFYRDLLGWTVQTFDMGEQGQYHILYASAVPFGGAVQMAPELDVPSHWISYVSCADVDAVVAKAVELGGRVGHGPMDIPDVGRFAVVLDPQGAAFAPMSALPGTPAAPEPVDGLVPSGCPIWNELATDDPDAATTFYAALFGWGTETVPMPQGGTYTLLRRGPETPSAGGLMQKPDLLPASTWIPYVQVTDAAAMVARAGELGGTALTPAFPVPEVGQVAWLQDPTGAVFAVMQPVTE